MEKINALIDKLQELKNSAASLQSMSYYTQLLQAEILHQRNLQKQSELSSHGHVAVIMPAHVHVSEPVPAPPPPAPVPVTPAAAAPVAAPATNGHTNGYAPDRVPVKQARPASEKPAASATLFDPPPPQPQPQFQPQPAPAPAPEANGIRRDLNELVGQPAASLNDRFSGKNMEIGEKIGSMGVPDLKSAIGINDKFQFMEALFRGDKTMYERSVKTINECANLQEAEYWIERELKIKLGWDESDPVAQHFYSLVRKRFS
ncbi:hypothetical protein [Chitinophaga sp.]|uniref:hypothetical protein n=1 Tax=Chitinophaga sp. TaxID=1869181 RepID=UPI0026054723|nr:hypothetical protein [uncultured Chitinophaga sp.]